MEEYLKSKNKQQRITTNSINMEFKEERAMEVEVEEIPEQPVSPTGQYFSSSVLSCSILAVLEMEIPIDESKAMTLLKNIFLPINPRFSSVMVTDERGVKQWKTVMVKLEDHAKFPKFPEGLSPESYDVHLQEYITKIGMDQLPNNRPLWAVHVVNYPTSNNAAATIIFNLHHALGDGYSLMAALLSSLRRADDPSLPLTLPSLQKIQDKKDKNMFKGVSDWFSMFLNSTMDFISGFLKSTMAVDDPTPIRSGTDGVEFHPITISTTTFSLDDVKQIKAKLGGTVNDIIVGTIFYGIRLYIQSVSKESNSARSTALVMLNTRVISGYQTVEDMAKPNAKATWGNQFAFLHIPIPNSTDAETADPLKFISEVKKITKVKKNSLAIHLTGGLLELIRKLKGPEIASRYIYKTLKNTSMTISHIIGPLEQVTIGNHPCSGMYFMMIKAPQSLIITVMGYMGKLRVTVGAEKDYINHQLLVSCMEKGFQKILQAALSQK